MIKIGLVDDHAMIVDSLKLLFGMMEDIEVVFTTTDPTEVLSLIRAERIDILVSDFRMPELDGLQLCSQIKSKHPDVKVLLLTVNENSKDIEDSFHAGASGYLLKKAGRQELRDAILTIHAGDIFFGQQALRSMLTKSDSGQSSTIQINKTLKSLTKREVEIIKLLAEELSSNEIAEQLYISTGTVETHRHNILKKLNVKSTVGVIKFAMKAKLVN